MKVISLFIFSALISTTLAHIELDIHPEELQRIAQLLVQNYINNNMGPLPESRVHFFLHHVKIFGFTTMNIIGLIISLASANVLTTIIEVKYGLAKSPPVTTAPATTTTIPTFKVNNDSEMSDDVIQFGCYRGVCWRSCNSQNVTANSLCYTSPIPEVYDYHRCSQPADCSPCWECVDRCKSMYLILL